MYVSYLYFTMNYHIYLYTSQQYIYSYTNPGGTWWAPHACTSGSWAPIPLRLTRALRLCFRPSLFFFLRFPYMSLLTSLASFSWAALTLASSFYRCGFQAINCTLAFSSLGMVGKRADARSRTVGLFARRMRRLWGVRWSLVATWREEVLGACSSMSTMLLKGVHECIKKERKKLL